MQKFKNVFVLCTGRCGSATLISACHHITNYSAGHETRVKRVGGERLNFPEGHIEADNRLSWFLGRLETHYGESAYYVHLTRESEAVARSYSKRSWWEGSITRAYRQGILMLSDAHELDICRDYVATVNANINMFLKDKPNQIHMSVENWQSEFPEFWAAIGAEGDLEAALKELATPQNTMAEMEVRKKNQKKKKLRSKVRNLIRSMGR